MPTELIGKPVSASATDDQTAIVFPNDLNALGTLFGGRVLDMADRVAAVVAHRHSGQTCVTLALDSVRFCAPAKHGDILVFKASVNRVWHTSMEVGIKCFVEDHRTSVQRHIFSAYFTFVALDEEGKATGIEPAIPQSDEQKRRYRQADERRKRRLQERERAICSLHPEL